jgi:putative transposase
MTHDERTLRMLTLIDEYTRESLAIRVARRLGRYEVIKALADVMSFRETPEHTSSREVREKTATAKASTGSCATNA